MVKIMKMILASGLIAIMAAAVPGQSQAEGLKLQLATGYGAKIPMNHVFKYLLAPRIEEYSDYRIETDVQQENKLCSEHKCVEQAKLGQIDIGSSSAGNLGAFGQAFDTNFLPFLFGTDAFAMKVLDISHSDGWYGKELAQRAREDHLMTTNLDRGTSLLINPHQIGSRQGHMIAPFPQSTPGRRPRHSHLTKEVLPSRRLF